jgi:hypothetical protein
MLFMDNTQFKNLEDSISHYNMFLNILNNGTKRYNNDKNQENFDDIVKTLVNQHTMNRITLQNLGHDFNENNKIKSLNEKIRDLEKQIGNDGTVDFLKMSQFIDTLSNKVNGDLKEQYGLNCYSKITVGESISITLEHISTYIPAKEWDLKYLNNDEEKEQMINEHETAYNISKENLNSSKEGEIFFTTENINFVEGIIKSTFSKYGKVSNIEYSLVNHGDKKEGHTLSNVKFRLITLASHLALIDTFELV